MNNKKLIFVDGQKKLIFKNNQEVLIFVNGARKLIFDETQPDITSGIGFMIIGSTFIIG